MRLILLPVALLLLSRPAFAIHAYDDENCDGKFKGHDVSTMAQSAFEGYLRVNSKIATDPNDDGAFGNLIQPKDPVPALDADTQIVVESVKVVNKKSKKYDDGCWEGFEGTFDRTLSVRAISPDAGTRLGLSVGDTLTLHCNFFQATPAGKSCP